MMKNIDLRIGDCLEVLKEIEDNSIDSIVTDPPYGLEFMGKKWDAPWKGQASKEFNNSCDGKLGGFKQLPNHSRVNNLKCESCNKWKFSSNPCKCDKPKFPNARLLAMQQFQNWFMEISFECFRVLKPGGHFLCFSGSRTYHRIASAIEDSGFEIRDQIMWIYGSGFPKSLNIGKAVDKLQGNQREELQPSGRYKYSFDNSLNGDIYGNYGNKIALSKGSSDWEGWGTALKPAHEPICMARKPFKGNVAQNVLEWGTGGINIDDSRVCFRGESDAKEANNLRYQNSANGGNGGEFNKSIEGVTRNQNFNGRFPANIILDEEAGKVMDLQSGTTKSSKRGEHNNKKTEHTNTYTPPQAMYSDENTYGNSGGASRFFYCAKASKKDRNEGCDTLEETTDTEMTNRKEGSNGLDWNNGKGGNAYAGASSSRNGNRKNLHPTVKPTDLMLYLIRLVTPKGGITLDPFMGSGSSGKAAVRGGFQFVGIEREAEYFEIAEARIEHEQKKPNQIKIFE